MRSLTNGMLLNSTPLAMANTVALAPMPSPSATTATTVEPPALVANLIRKALEYVPPERLIISADCGFGREGLSRRIAFYKCVSLVMGTNIVRKELGLPEVEVRAADPRFAFREA
jgi:hypothetical protein